MLDASCWYWQQEQEWAAVGSADNDDKWPDDLWCAQLVVPTLLSSATAASLMLMLDAAHRPLTPSQPLLTW